MKAARNDRPRTSYAIWAAAAAAALLIVDAWLKGTAIGLSYNGPTHPGPSAVAETADHAESQSLPVEAERTRRLSVGDVTGGQPLGEWLKRLMAQDDDRFQWRHLTELFDALHTVEEIETALNVMKDSQRNERECVVLLQMLAELDPKEAVRFATMTTERVGDDVGVAAVIKVWVKQSPEAALAWAREYDEQSHAIEGEQDRGDAALAGVVRQLAKVDLDRALTEASRPGRQVGFAAVATIFNEVVGQRGLDAAKELVGGLPKGGFRDLYIVQLVGKLAETSPSDASDWAMRLPFGDAKPVALSQAVEAWLDKDPDRAATFVNALPVGPDADGARILLALKIASSDVDRSIAPVCGISDPESKWQTILDIASALSHEDLDAGLEYVAKSNLPPEAKATISKLLAQKR
jgi:hypothetical protein